MMSAPLAGILVVEPGHGVAAPALAQMPGHAQMQAPGAHTKEVSG